MAIVAKITISQKIQNFSSFEIKQFHIFLDICPAKEMMKFVFADDDLKIKLPNDFFQFRKEAVSHLLALDLPAAEKLNTISPIAASLCSHPKEVSGSSANDITHVLANIERTLESDFNTMQYEELIRCSKNYLMAAAAVVKTCSVNGIDVRRNTSTITNDWDVSQVI